jgi:hypothetical protein
LVLDVTASLDDHLPDHRSCHPRDLADVTVVDGDVAPPDHALPLGSDRVLDQLLEFRAALGVTRQVADADPVAADRRQLDAGDRAADERVGDLQQDPGAVAGVRVRALGASSAFSTTACVASPQSFATSAIPQLSCS